MRAYTITLKRKLSSVIVQKQIWCE